MSRTPEEDRHALEALEGPCPPPGTRNATLRDGAFALARAGYTNHEIISAVQEAGSRWGYLPEDNLWARYSSLVRLVEEVRLTVPSPHP